MLNYFEEKKETYFDYKKEIFSKSKKSHAFGQKILFFLYFDLIKIRLEIMLSDFQEKKNLFWPKKNRENF